MKKKLPGGSNLVEFPLRRGWPDVPVAEDREPSVDAVRERPFLPNETLEEIVHNIAQLNHVAQWFSAQGSCADSIAATEAAGRLSEALGEHMCAIGIRMIETTTHRATLTSYCHDAQERHSVLVVQRRMPVVEASGPKGEDRKPVLRAQPDDKDGLVRRPADQTTTGPEPPSPPDGLFAAPSPGEKTPHGRLCPLGGGATRWYACFFHEPAVIFQAGSGFYDSVANSCPRCRRLAQTYAGCACEEASRPVDRRQRRRRPGRVAGSSLTTSMAQEDGGLPVEDVDGGGETGPGSYR